MGGIFVLRSLLSRPLEERIQTCKEILTTDSDPSLHVEALWVFADSFNEIPVTDPLRDEIGKFLESILLDGQNEVVRHEVCYLIGENNLRKQIPSLRAAISSDPSELVRHEAVEAIGLLQDFTSIDLLRKSLSDPSSAVRQTAEIVLKQLERAEKKFI